MTEEHEGDQDESVDDGEGVITEEDAGLSNKRG